MGSRRPPLAAYGILSTAEGRKHRVPEHTHAGLWYDKFLDQQFEQKSQSFVPYASKKTPYQEHVQAVSTLTAPPLYEAYFARWKTALENSDVHLYVGRTRGRQVIGLGGAGVIENGIRLHHTYGVPYLPGSALKGLTAHYAHNFLAENWQNDSAAYKFLFGTQTQQGAVTFHDALPEAFKFSSDILTVHHSNYYQKGDVPADWDNPVPIPFLTVYGGTFWIPLSGPAEWVETAVIILHGALSELGIGAKTASGYGRMSIKKGNKDFAKPELPPAPDPITLAENAVIPAVVAHIEEEMVELTLNPDDFANVSPDATHFISLTAEPGQTFEVGQAIWCVVVDCYLEENEDVMADCRLATEDERPN
ncbi:MAG: type III-B CRISPR module RAMP protein Cmr6 [Chloroflexota bacterium]